MYRSREVAVSTLNVGGCNMSRNTSQGLELRVEYVIEGKGVIKGDIIWGGRGADVKIKVLIWLTRISK